MKPFISSSRPRWIAETRPMRGAGSGITGVGRENWRLVPHNRTVNSMAFKLLDRAGLCMQITPRGGASFGTSIDGFTAED